MVAVVVAGALVTSCDSGTRSDRSTATTSATSPAAVSAPDSADSAAAPSAPAGWRAMAPTPLAGRVEPAVVWTGEELLVVGGTRDDVAEPGQPAEALTSDGRALAVTRFVDGAAYDPATDTWRPIAAAPGTGLSNDAVWTGERVLVRGTTSEATNAPPDAAIFSYDPASDGWEVYPAPDGAGDTLDVTMTWTGTELIFWGHPYRRYTEPPLAAGLDPATGTWRDLPAASLPAGMGPAAAWDGDEVVVAAGMPMSVGPEGAPTPTAAFDPAADTWRSLPPAPTEVPGMQPDLLPIGDGLLLAGGTFAQDRSTAALAFDLDTERWSPAGQMDGDLRYGEQRVWTGRELIEVGGVDATTVRASVGALDPDTGLARSLPDLPEPRASAGAAWTGSELLVWGGQPDVDGIGTALATGVRLALDS